jgi:hypothetical protein
VPFVDHHESAGKRAVDQVVFTTGRGRELGEWRMYRTAVIALGVVLEQQLPVGAYVILYGARDGEVGQVEPGETPDQPSVSLLERLRIFGEIDEEKSFPGLDGNAVEWIIHLTKTFDVSR